MGRLLDNTVVIAAVEQIEAQRKVFLAVPFPVAAGIGQHHHLGLFPGGFFYEAGEKLRHIVEKSMAVADEKYGDVESTKAVSDLVSPVSGTIVAVNEELADAPETLNSDPYGAWIIKVEGVTAQEELLDAAAYEAFCAEEA